MNCLTCGHKLTESRFIGDCRSCQRKAEYARKKHVKTETQQLEIKIQQLELKIQQMVMDGIVPGEWGLLYTIFIPELLKG